MIKTGGAANPPDRAGLADLTAHMLDEGTKTRSALAIADQVASLGATLSTRQHLGLVERQPVDAEQEPGRRAGHVRGRRPNPTFDPKEFERVRDNLLTAITRRKDSPPTVANLAFTRLLYGAEASLRLADGGRRGVDQEADARRPARLLRRRTTGPTTPRCSSRATRPRRRCAPSWRRRSRSGGEAARPPRSCPRPRAPRRPRKIFLIDKADAPQSSIRVGLIGIDRKSPDYFPVTVMNLILGGGFYRLDLNLREGKGWTYGARSTFDSRRAPGPFSAGGEFVAPHTADSVAEILKELASMRDADVTDVELARAKDQIIKSFPARFATRGNVAAQLAELAVFGLPDSYSPTTRRRSPPSARTTSAASRASTSTRTTSPSSWSATGRRWPSRSPSWPRSRSAISTAIRSPAGHDLRGSDSNRTICAPSPSRPGR